MRTCWWMWQKSLRKKKKERFWMMTMIRFGRHLNSLIQEIHMLSRDRTKTTSSPCSQLIASSSNKTTSTNYRSVPNDSTWPLRIRKNGRPLLRSNSWNDCTRPWALARAIRMFVSMRCTCAARST
uniref:Uncharacterized protein n=2 Tax=Cacopsylla melanoneura TaxID=428564 RepID=A0A8D8QAV7_9HEMI